MPAIVTLNVTQGELKGKEFTFEERTTCIMGRSHECYPRLPNDEAHRKISRHHCLLDINPPDIRVRDFGSLNGTFVNGEKIGQRERDHSPEEAQKMKFPEYDLKEGDEITLGDTIFRVGIYVPAICMDCAKEIPEEQRESSRVSAETYQCKTCHDKLEEAQRQAEAQHQKVATPKLPPKGPTCPICGKDVSQEIGKNRHGEYVCVSCRKDPMKIMFWLLRIANQGKKELVTIKGYSILKELGRGGMGAVYLAQHDKTGQQVALKVMLPQVAADKNSEERFLRETALTKALKHPNVVQLYDHGCSEGTFFFTLEFCDGGSIDYLTAKRGGKLPVDEAVKIMLQLLNGLEYAHTQHNLVHRDIKPGNFFLSGSGNQRIAKIADYGFAKAFDTAGLSGLTMTGSVAGTPPFMPRQQVINFKYSKPEVDVWAMAASLYNMLTGQVPRDFQRGKDPWMVLLKESPVPIRRRDASIPQKLADVIDQALIDNPEITFKTAAEFKRTLEAAL
jgi:serine/threonine-protein kinase